MDCSARQQRATEEWWTQHNQKWQENQDQNGQKADGAWKRAKKKMKKQNERTEHVFTKRFIFLYFCWCRKVCLRDINIHVHIYTHKYILKKKIPSKQLREQGQAFGSAHTIGVKMDQSIQTHSEGLVWIKIIHFLFDEFWSVHFLCCDVTLSCAFNFIALPGCNYVPFFCYTDLKNPQNSLEVFLVVLPHRGKTCTTSYWLQVDLWNDTEFILAETLDSVSIPTEWGRDQHRDIRISYLSLP